MQSAARSSTFYELTRGAVVKQTGMVLLLTGIALATTIVVFRAAPYDASRVVLAADKNPRAITIDYPLDGSIFPPEITPPTFIWRDAAEAANVWRIEVTFADGFRAMRFESLGARLSLGEIDPRTVSPNNEMPKLTPQLAEAHTWTMDAKSWDDIKKHSVAGPAEVVITGLSQTKHGLSAGRVSIQTSNDPVGAPIFYRDVPLMPSETEKGVIKPLAANAIQLIQWRLRSIEQPQSRIVLKDMHTCANCHSFSLDGKTMGLDMDGPQNDKGLYALVPIKPQITIRNQDMVSWNPSQDRQFGLNRVGFMSQVSPDGQYVLTTFTSPDKVPRNNFYVMNFKDYRFLQVFFPTRGILAWYSRATGERHPLPGADDPRYVQASGVWSPDGKYVVFARAEAQDPYPADGKMAAYANDPNEIQIKYDLYRVPFNGGKGGRAEPIVGASANGMSNSFPKVSPDGRWIVFVQARNAQLMRPDSQLYIVPAQGGQARRLRANMAPMNSWHSFSPNGRWLVFSSKSRSPYTQMYLTHIDDDGNDSPAILVDNTTAANRAVNIPEFVNIPPDGMLAINTPAVNMYREFDNAVELGEKGQDEAAIVKWRKLAVDNPDEARIYNNLGAALARMGRFDDAIPQYEKALELNSQYHLVHGNLARALMEAGREDEANVQFEMALTVDPGSADLHNSFGSALAKQGRLDQATRQFAKAVELNPRLAEAHNNLGQALLSLEQPGQPGQVAEAEKEFRTAISLNPRYAEAQNNLGTLYGQEGNDAAAERLFREAIENDPTYAPALVNLGATLASESHFAEADVWLEKALRIEPGNKEAQNLRALITTMIKVKDRGAEPVKVVQ
jgi:Flp pilus assembly protein TadD